MAFHLKKKILYFYSYKGKVGPEDEQMEGSLPCNLTDYCILLEALGDFLSIFCLIVVTNCLSKATLGRVHLGAQFESTVLRGPEATGDRI